MFELLTSGPITGEPGSVDQVAAATERVPDLGSLVKLLSLPPSPPSPAALQSRYLQDSKLIRTVWPCVQARTARMFPL